MLLDVLETLVDDMVVMELTGRLALGRESQRVEARIGELAAGGGVKIVLDMTGVSYIDSAGIGLLAMTAGRLKETGGRLAVVAPAEGRTTHLLKLTQMHALLRLCTGMEEARAALA